MVPGQQLPKSVDTKTIPATVLGGSGAQVFLPKDPAAAAGIAEMFVSCTDAMWNDMNQLGLQQKPGFAATAGNAPHASPPISLRIR